MDELNEIKSVNIWEKYQDETAEDPDSSRYRIDGYEDFLTPRNIVNPRYRTLYEPEVEPQFTNENSALDGLLKKAPSELIAPEKKRIVVLLRAQGWTINEICRKVELSKPTVIKVIRKFASEISNLKRTELEELLQTYSLTLKKRIHTYGVILGTLMAELQTRDLKNVPTDRLIDLILRCQKAVGDDILAKIAAGADEGSKLSKADLY